MRVQLRYKKKKKISENDTKNMKNYESNRETKIKPTMIFNSRSVRANRCNKFYKFCAASQTD